MMRAVVNGAEVNGAEVNGAEVNDARPATWTFLTNHAHVLVCIAEQPDIRGRDIAARVGITERAAQAIVSDLVSEGYVTRTREGRRNRYEVLTDAPLRHPLEHDHTVGELLVTLGRLAPGDSRAPTRPSRRLPSAVGQQWRTGP